MASQKTEHKCHVHDKLDVWEVEHFRRVTCVNDEPLTLHTDGKYYCLFHLPTKNKDVWKFEEKFRARLREVEEKSAAVKKLPEDKQKQAKNGVSYNFQYVWFPSRVEVMNHNFSSPIYFDSANFSVGVNFHKASFSANSSFREATFSGTADMSFATFSANADFYSATFSDAIFLSTRFSAGAMFNWTEFSGAVAFNRATFSKTETIDFTRATFTKVAFFNRTRFRNHVSFYSAIFGADSDVFFRGAFFAANANFQYCTAEGYLRFSNLRQGENCKFDFQEAAFEKASRVSFHTVDLRPHWFVNVDSRKFSFTDIFWINRDWDFWNKNIYAELDSMDETGAVKQKKRIFEVAARQLAVNAEENNRYEDAVKFRYMAMETRRLEETKHFSFSRFLMWLYKWSSGYGESSPRALIALIGIWLFFGFLYFLLGSFHSDSPLNIWQSLGFSSLTMLLQKPDPRPASNLTFTLYILEMIAAPVQAALLALAIRRKFMR